MAYCYNGVVSSYVRYEDSGTQIFNAINVSGGKDSFCFYGMHDKHDDTYYLQSYYLPTNGVGKYRYDFNINIKEIKNEQERVRTKSAFCTYPSAPYIITVYDINFNKIKPSLVTFTNIPIFDYDDKEGINNYLKNGDTSSAIKDIKTDWNLYVDGKSNPLYKLTWECNGL